MKIVASSDWRDDIPFETPMVVADLVPGDPAGCAVCRNDAELWPRTQLWAVKHRHPKHHGGHVRFYCAAHVPAPPAPAPTAPAAPARAGRPAPRSARTAPRPERTVAARRTPWLDERPRAVCPTCFVEVPASGTCGFCGETVA